MKLLGVIRHRVIYGVESWNGVVEWSGVEWSLEWSGVYFITMLFAYWNLELSWEIRIKCSLKHKHNDNSISKKQNRFDKGFLTDLT